MTDDLSPKQWQDLQVENDEDLRLKLRHLRTAHKELSRAAERDGLYGEEIAALTTAIDALAVSAEAALTFLREMGPL